MGPLDLTHIPLVDNHCHGIYRTQDSISLASWRRNFTESTDPGMFDTHVAYTLFYRRLMHALASFFNCEETEDTILKTLQTCDYRGLVQRLLLDANFAALIMDKGHPPAEKVFSDAEHAQLAQCRVAPLLRVELLMQEIIIQQSSLSAVIDELRAVLLDARKQGYVGLKSIVAYRTGLAIETWDDDVVARAFTEARREVQKTGTLRLGHKPLLDTLLHIVFQQAAQQELPIQFHTGYGDADADMLLANPLHLRAIFERREYRSMPIVLLHESYLYTRQGAYLAAVYENAYLDLSYGIPFLGYHEMLDFTRAAFDVAPTSKLLYSSDGIGVPEIHWLSAHDGRRIIGAVLGERIETGELSVADAESAGAAVLRDNALNLYGLKL